MKGNKRINVEGKSEKIEGGRRKGKGENERKDMELGNKGKKRIKYIKGEEEGETGEGGERRGRVMCE